MMLSLVIKDSCDDVVDSTWLPCNMVLAFKVKTRNFAKMSEGFETECLKYRDLILYNTELKHRRF